MSLTGTGITGALTGKEYTIPNTGSTAGNWVRQTFNFTVTDPTKTITLSFSDDNTHAGSAGAYTSSLANYTGSSNLAIDNVTVGAVPEPSTLFGAFFLSLTAGAAALRRRQVA